MKSIRKFLNPNIVLKMKREVNNKCFPEIATDAQLSEPAANASGQ